MVVVEVIVLGDCVGSSLGAFEGDALVGWPEGASVGCCVGKVVVGLEVGDIVGAGWMRPEHSDLIFIIPPCPSTSVADM